MKFCVGGTMRTEVLGNEHLLRFIQLHPKSLFSPKIGTGSLWKTLFCGKVEIYANVVYCISFL